MSALKAADLKEAKEIAAKDAKEAKDVIDFAKVRLHLSFQPTCWY
jgi:hypothetical protein